MPKIVGLFRSRAGRERAFKTLVSPHLPAMYRMAWRWTGHTQDAEDLVQDTLVKLIGRLDTLAQVEQRQPWLIKALYRTHVDNWRKRKRSPGQDAADPGDEALETIETADGAGTDRIDLHRDLQRAVDALSDEHRDVVLLHDVEGYSAVEIADILGVSDGTVKSRLHRARSRLKKLLVSEGTFDSDRSC